MGGGLHKQFRAFFDDADFNNVALREGAVSAIIPDIIEGGNYSGAAGLYGGATAVTGAGTGIFSTYTGDITVTSATGAVSAMAFNGELQGIGVAEPIDYSYVQIGHAGATNGMQRVSSFGNITVSGTEVLFHAGNDSRTGSYAQLGHGGYNSDAVTDGHVGNIMVTATTGKVEFLGGQDAVYGAGSSASAPQASYAQLGNGGYSSTGPHSGTITVNAGSNGGVGVNFIGGNTTNSYVQLGHGGYGSKGGPTSTPQGFVGDITVNSVGSITFTAGSSVDDGTSSENGQIYAQLGHGGYDSDAANTNTNYLTNLDWGHSGDIIVNPHQSLHYEHQETGNLHARFVPNCILHFLLHRMHRR